MLVGSVPSFHSWANEARTAHSKAIAAATSHATSGASSRNPMGVSNRPASAATRVRAIQPTLEGKCGRPTTNSTSMASTASHGSQWRGTHRLGGSCSSSGGSFFSRDQRRIVPRS